MFRDGPSGFAAGQFTVNSSFITLHCDQMWYIAQLYTIILFRTIYFVSVDEIADKPFDLLVYGIRMPDTQ